MNSLSRVRVHTGVTVKWANSEETSELLVMNSIRKREVEKAQIGSPVWTRFELLRPKVRSRSNCSNFFQANGVRAKRAHPSKLGAQPRSFSNH